MTRLKLTMLSSSLETGCDGVNDYTRQTARAIVARQGASMSERAAICTLFEGDYHYGLGALANSLYRHGYRGTIWAGYRGALPPWASSAGGCPEDAEFPVADGCAIRFLRLQTDRHLTNYKPDFLADLWQRFCPDADALFYFDPDIVIKCAWSFFEEWASYGVALCEDINSPMPSSHPIRQAWRGFCGENGVPLPRELDAYVSGGFVGLSRKHAALLVTWKKLIQALEGKTGNLKQIGFGDRPYAFYNADQDVLNMTLMSTSEPLSLIGREGMDFIPGGYTMSHAAGGVKPWRKRMLWSALRGIPPTLPDKAYWQNTRCPLRLYSAAAAWLHRCDLVAASAVGRVLRRA